MIKAMAILAAIALALPVAAWASGNANAGKIIDGLDELHRAGVALHEKYDLSDLSQLQECVQESRPLRARAKAYQKAAKALIGTPGYWQISKAADDAFVCVYCSNDISLCTKMPPELEAAREALAGIKR